MTLPDDAHLRCDDAMVEALVERREAAGIRPRSEVALSVAPPWRGWVDAALEEVAATSDRLEPREAQVPQLRDAMTDAITDVLVRRYLLVAADPERQRGTATLTSLGRRIAASLARRIATDGRSRLLPATVTIDQALGENLDDYLQSTMAAQVDETELASLGFQPLPAVRAALLEALTFEWAQWRTHGREPTPLRLPLPDARRRQAARQRTCH